MKRFPFIVLLVIFLLQGCGRKEGALRIEEDTLVLVLADVHIAEAAMQNLPRKQKDSIAMVYYDQIYEMHGVEREDFKETMLALKKDAIRLASVYNKVIERLAVLEVDPEKKQSPQKN